MRYRENGRAIASVVFLWPGMVATFARFDCPHPLASLPCRYSILIESSTALLWHSLSHIDAHGPKSTHARNRDGVSADAEKPAIDSSADTGGGVVPSVGEQQSSVA